MTLKTLKPKANNSLTLDDEFLQYCELNHIEDVQKLAKETFKRGFDILKYGKIPDGLLTRTIPNELIKPTVGVQSTNKKIILDEKSEKVIKEPKKVEKNDLYDE